MSDIKRINRIKKIEEISGENAYKCVGCGKCSAFCPFSSEMDMAPNQVLRHVQRGSKEVLQSVTPQICASCFACSVDCPMGVDLSKIMEAIREIYLRKGRNFIDVDSLDGDKLQGVPQILLVSSFRKNTGP